MLPPGLYYDEAFDGLDAHRIAMGGYFPVYLPGNNGREPLYMYLAALFIKLLGPTAYTLRAYVCGDWRDDDSCSLLCSTFHPPGPLGQAVSNVT